MNKHIIKSSLSSNRLIYAIFALCSVGTIVSIMWIFPNMVKDNTFADLLSTLPQKMRDSLGLVGDVNKLTEYLNMNYYNAIYLYIMIAFNLVIITKLISKPVGDTSLVYYLNSPVSRRTFFLSQTVVYVIGLVIMTLSSILAGIVTHWVLLNEYEFEAACFIRNNIIIGLLFLLLGSICLMVCSICNSNAEALAFCSGIMVVEYIMFMLKNMDEKLEKLKYFTVFSLYDTEKIEADPCFFAVCTSACLIISIVVGFVASEYFKRKDLYL